MIEKLVFISTLTLLLCITDIKSQKITVENVEAVLNGSIKCDFSLKYTKEIDPKKLNLTWYNQRNTKGISYTLDVASEKLKQNSIFWLYPSLNIYLSGYGFSSKTVDSKILKNAFLYVKEPIMLIDYSAYSGTSDPGYVDAVLSLYKIGEVISELLIDLVNAGMDRREIRLMGISLGGQLAGNIARAFQRNYGANVGRVTALDPAGPCFDRAIPVTEESTKRDDADFVEIYNLNRGKLGTTQILGHANFLINGGGPKQMACERYALINIVVPEFRMQCAHAITSVAFWEKSIKGDNFVATQCDNLDEALRDDCDGYEYQTGLYTSSSLRGIFYVYFNYSISLTFVKASLTELLSVLG